MLEKVLIKIKKNIQPSVAATGYCNNANKNCKTTLTFVRSSNHNQPAIILQEIEDELWTFWEKKEKGK